MALHPRTVILQAIAATVTGLPTTAGRVYRGRPTGDRWLQDSELPALLIQQGADNRNVGESDAVRVSYHELEVVITAVAQLPGTTEAEVTDLLNQIELEVVDAMLATEKPWFGLPDTIISQVEHLGTETPIAGGSGDRPAVEMALTWLVQYQRSRVNFGV